MTTINRKEIDSKSLNEFGEDDKELAQLRQSPSFMTEEDHQKIITLIPDEEDLYVSDGKPPLGSPASIKQSSRRSNKQASLNKTGITLDFTGFRKADSKNGQTDLNSGTAQEPAIQERSINVVFELPDGSQGEQSFKLGQTVEVLKSYVEIEYGIPMNEQNLYLDERKLENPFSLLDYPESKGCEELFVRVEGELPSFSKK